MRELSGPNNTEINRHLTLSLLYRDTQTDESESEPETSDDGMMLSLRNEIEALQAELLSTKKRLEQKETENAIAIRKVKDMEERMKEIKEKKEKEIHEIRRKAA